LLIAAVEVEVGQNVRRRLPRRQFTREPGVDPGGDRMLVAQAREEKMALVSNEKIFDDFDVTRVW
jgi:PIN domain nuclease of toxin-antitoxin system